MAAHKHAIIVVAILAIAAVAAAGCGNDTKNADSSTSASQASIDALSARVQRDEMLFALVTVSNMPLHDLDETLQGGKIDGKYLPTLRTLIRVLALTEWTSDLTEFTTRMHEEAVALLQGLNSGKDAEALKDMSSALHTDADAFGATVGNVVAKDLPPDAGGPGPTKASTQASGSTPATPPVSR